MPDTVPPPPEETVPLPHDVATAILIQIAGILIEGAKTTKDARLIELQENVVKTLKEGEAFETLLVAFTKQTEPEPELPPDPYYAVLSQKMAAHQARRK